MAAFCADFIYILNCNSIGCRTTFHVVDGQVAMASRVGLVRVGTVYLCLAHANIRFQFQRWQ